MDMLTPEQKAEFEGMMNNLQNQFLHSFVQTRSGIVIQRHKISLPPIDDKPESSSANDDKLKGVNNEEVQQEDGTKGIKKLQDSIDYAVYHALINQSGVLINTSSNIVGSMVDSKIAENQAKGPVFLPGGKFPNYRTLVTDKQQPVSGVAPGQPMASISAQQQPIIPSSAHRQPEFQPHVLIRPQPQHVGQNIPHASQEQIAAMFKVNQLVPEPIQQVPIRPQTPIQQHQPVGAQFIPNHQVHMAHQTPPPHMGGNINQLYQPYSPLGQYGPAPSPQPQYVPQYNQYDPAQ